MNIDSIKHQPLRMPAGWHVTQNVFFEIDPDPAQMFKDGSRQRSTLGLFIQDMFHAKHDHYNVVVDLGWCPDEDPNGSFVLQAIRGTDWDKPLVEFESRSRLAVVQRLESILLDVSAGKYPQPPRSHAAGEAQSRNKRASR